MSSKIERFLNKTLKLGKYINLALENFIDFSREHEVNKKLDFLLQSGYNQCIVHYSS
jgi:hypothetical protein